MKTDNREVFEQLGNLFYSIAVGNSIKPIEVSELKMLISKDWMNHPQGSDLPIPQGVNFLFFELDTLQGNEVSPAEAYTNFAKFYCLHPEVFTEALVERIRDTATSINFLFPSRVVSSKDFYEELLTLLQRHENILELQ